MSEHNITFLATDYHQTDVLKSCFKDSEITKNISLNRTKTTAHYKKYNRLSKKELVSYLKTARFSILTDESTDIGTVKSSQSC